MVRFETVAMRYDKGPEVLRDISFTLPPGSFRFLTGPSGAGKSSLLRLLYLAERPSRGSITLFGRDLLSVSRREFPSLRRQIGVVFQDFRLLDHLTALDNVALPLRVARVREKEVIRHVSELLSWVGLGDKLKAFPPTLSGGEKQRIAIARAVVSRPRLLLADEPTGNIDALMGRRLMRLFVELNKLGTSVVIATHDHSLILESGQPVLSLVSGRLTETMDSL